ncbi:MAG: PilT/PilU family type 4a pilus ATPase [Candidatus Omnitrophica bacterium]|nr:PilT/PilU family type 4a pilus ATPase [Candidatus Omnitrophota bacterium]
MGFKEYLKLMVEKNASDMFFRVGGKVHMRLNGQVLPVADNTISIDDMEQALKEMLSEEMVRFFRNTLDLDFALYVPELSHRFRVSIFMQRNWPSVVIRNIPSSIDSMDNLHLPTEILKKLASESRGLVLLTGTMGSGKSTTISSMIEYINENCHKHILTIEEPIEYTFKDKNSIVNQRELGKDVNSYPVALRSFTLQSPDVIYVGNIRDYETMSAALTAAETGVLVLSTLHTVNASRTVERIINFFPPHQQPQIRSQLSSLLKGVISQRLVPLKDGSGRIPACEIMLLSPTISRLMREGKGWEMNQYIEDGAIFGMQSFNQALVTLVHEDKITVEDAMNFSDNKDEFLLCLKGFKKM